MEINKTIIIASLCFSFIVNSIMFGWEATRRSAEDETKIMSAQSIKQLLSQENQTLADMCLKANGKPEIGNDGRMNCK